VVKSSGESSIAYRTGSLARPSHRAIRNRAAGMEEGRARDYKKGFGIVRPEGAGISQRFRFDRFSNALGRAAADGYSSGLPPP